MGNTKSEQIVVYKTQGQNYYKGGSWGGGGDKCHSRWQSIKNISIEILNRQ